MLEFIRAMQNTLSRIPRCGSPEIRYIEELRVSEYAFPYDLDSGLAVRRYHALHPMQKRGLDVYWRIFSSLMLLHGITYLSAVRFYRLLDSLLDDLQPDGAGHTAAIDEEIAELANELDRYINAASTPAELLPEPLEHATFEDLSGGKPQ